MLDIKINKIDNRYFLEIGEELVEVSDYKLKSSADGATELTVVISGVASLFESSASLEVLMKQR